MSKFWKIIALAALLASPASAEYPDGVNGHAVGFGGWSFPGGGTPQVEVDAIWTVPTISYDSTVAPTGQQLFQWVGVSGGAGKLAQAGIIQFFASGNGVETLYPFWECFGTNSIQMIAQPVAHGDVIFSQVTCTANCTSNAAGQKWTFTVQNITQNWTFNQTNFTCVTSLNTAWVGGLEPVNDNPIPKPNSGQIEFHDIHLNSAHPTMTTAQGMYLYTTASGATLNASNPNGTNDGFIACWGDDGLGGFSGPYEPCKYPVTTNNPGRSFRFGF